MQPMPAPTAEPSAYHEAPPLPHDLNVPHPEVPDIHFNEPDRPVQSLKGATSCTPVTS